MVEGVEPELLKNGDLYDFNEAIDNYGFDFDNFSEKNFESFIKTTFITDFITFRKSYLMRDFIQVRFYAHKFKGLFRLILSKNINENCEKLQMNIQKGDINVEKLYVKIVNEMVFFFKNFVTFSEKIKKPIYKELQDKFWELNNLCNNYEDFSIKSQITNKDIDIDDLIIDRKNQNVCCEVGNSIVCILF
jgi:hypothetical protein